MIEVTKGGVRLHLFIQPKASKNEIVGPHNGELKIKLTAPPVDGKANSELINFLAETYGIPKRRIQITKGETGRHKTVEIEALTLEEAQSILE